MKLKYGLMVLYHKLLRDGATVFDEILITFTEDTRCAICDRTIKEIPIKAQINAKKEIRFVCIKCDKLDKFTIPTSSL